MIDYGWISLDRKILNHWLMDNSKYFHAWVLILFHVNFEEKKVMIKGRLYTCKRGQSLYSLENWARIFGRDWTRRQVRTFFDTLESRSMVGRESDNKTSYLTVCNYDTYQGSGSGRSPAEVQQKSSTRPQLKKDKKEKKDKNIIIGKKPKKVFVKPDLMDVKKYCIERNNSVDPERWLNHYVSNGWKVGRGNSMADWKAAIRTWEKNNYNQPQKSMSFAERDDMNYGNRINNLQRRISEHKPVERPKIGLV